MTKVMGYNTQQAFKILIKTLNIRKDIELYIQNIEVQKINDRNI